MRPTVFLDLDDVLVGRGIYNSYQVIQLFEHGTEEWPELWQGLMHIDAKENLKLLHAEFSPLYVISSSWTTQLGREQMILVFERTGLEFVACNLHEEWTTPKSKDSSRISEIEAWLGKNSKGEALLILDDHHSGWTLLESTLYQQGKVVICDIDRCFVADRLKEARQLLLAQLENN
ncbi:HAD domain-containing protein [Oxalicibacterium faecigallinarum]|uniref:Uncharacterized protein n=1 Tax=Oxalicibacterium faecigallinarum TaxID=573741 RepID=A0A8J3F2C8_9BURK|nr:HAD domain-containing protein [Oxalicibacterium faecigallinarum]GGI17596.1 hypothetical protein GCM10008066_09770 [Oxalicibacterium faecigallinarum]